MKKLSIDEMECTLGGDSSEFWGTACAVWGALRVFRVFAFTTPATAALALATDITCTLIGLHEVADEVINS
jgi:hypothetical protein